MAVPDMGSLLEQINKAEGMWSAVIWSMCSFPFQLEKRVRNSSYSHGMHNNGHLRFCLRLCELPCPLS